MEGGRVAVKARSFFQDLKNRAGIHSKQFITVRAQTLTTEHGDSRMMA